MGERSVKTEVTVLRDGGAAPETLEVVTETPLTVFVNGKELITLVTTGDANRELAVGFLLAEGFLSEPGDIGMIRQDDEAGIMEIELGGDLKLAEKLWEKRTITSGCGKGATFYSVLDSLQSRPIASGLTVTPGQVHALMKELNARSDLYRATHGVHNCALADPDRILVFRDDIGRHNAVDKIRGHCFLEGIDLADRILITTGRLSSEIVIKVAKMGLPVLVSRSAPTSLAVELARKVGMSLVGGVKGGKMVVFCGEERIQNT